VVTVTIEVAGQTYTFTLNGLTHKWAATSPEDANKLLEESEFPLIGHAGEKRYELYSDGTFAEVEL
jgi:hypothetical protein